MTPATEQSDVVHALSFDIEDWFHMVAIDAVADSSKWPNLPSLVERYTDQILETLQTGGVRATFFMLGWVADRYPRITRQIADGGHEIACHSYWHKRVDQMTPNEFRDDTRRTLDILEQQTGGPILGYRAPSFSITPGAEWALDVLRELGFTYDASLFPAPRGHGGYPCPQEVHDFTATPSGEPLRELPMSILRWGKLKLAFSGGGYMRLLPAWLIRHGFDTFERARTPVVVYLHPRDFAPDCPRVPMPPHRRFKSYVGLGSTQRKLEMLLRNYRFDTCAKVAGVA
jgi:peptidoglycan-N-acetylglucosamine deacetylase